MISLSAQLDGQEAPDIASSSDDYAGRFAGPVGEYFLSRQASIVLRLLEPWKGGTVLDVGGGHAQLAPVLAEHGYRVTVLGSTIECGARLARSAAAEHTTFVTGNLLRLPFGDQEFDAAISFRILSHLENWQTLIAELCRVARQAVVLDYPDVRSINMLSRRALRLKKAIEKNTRTFRCYRRSEVLNEFRRHGFGRSVLRPQYVVPMVVHRALGVAPFSRFAETVADKSGLTRLVGSPVIVRAVRQI